MKLNKKGYMLVEIIVSFVLAFSIAMYLLNLAIKFKNTNEDIYYSAKYLSDKNLITRNIMNDLDRGIIKEIANKTTNGTYPYIITFKLFIDETTEDRMLRITPTEIEYGKVEDGIFITTDVSYYKKTFETSLTIDKPIITIEDDILSLRIPIKSIYTDEVYDLILMSPSVKLEEVNANIKLPTHKI